MKEEKNILLLLYVLFVAVSCNVNPPKDEISIKITPAFLPNNIYSQLSAADAILADSALQLEKIQKKENNSGDTPTLSKQIEEHKNLYAFKGEHPLFNIFSINRNPIGFGDLPYDSSILGRATAIDTATINAFLKFPKIAPLFSKQIEFKWVRVDPKNPAELTSGEVWDDCYLVAKDSANINLQLNKSAVKEIRCGTSMLIQSREDRLTYKYIPYVTIKLNYDACSKILKSIKRDKYCIVSVVLNGKSYVFPYSVSKIFDGIDFYTFKDESEFISKNYPDLIKEQPKSQFEDFLIKTP